MTPKKLGWIIVLGVLLVLSPISIYVGVGAALHTMATGEPITMIGGIFLFPVIICLLTYGAWRKMRATP